MGKQRKPRIHLKRIEQSALTDVLRIPPEISAGETRVTITGGGRVWLENYQGLLEYTEKSIVLQGKRGRIFIEGEKLRVDYFTARDMVVRGNIRAVRYDVRERGDGRNG